MVIMCNKTYQFKRIGYNSIDIYHKQIVQINSIYKQSKKRQESIDKKNILQKKINTLQKKIVQPKDVKMKQKEDACVFKCIFKCI